MVRTDRQTGREIERGRQIDGQSERERKREILRARESKVVF